MKTEIALFLKNALCRVVKAGYGAIFIILAVAMDKKAFELFVDIGEEPTSGIAKGVRKVKISQAFKHIGEELIFLFDYGDGWQFNVELKEIRNDEKRDLKPIILESIGKAPLQYPPCEDEIEKDEA